MQANKKEEYSGEQSVSSLDIAKPSLVDGWPFKRTKDTYDSVKPVVSIQVSTPGRSRIEPDAELYDMNHKRRGVALIFNHVNFKNMSMRKGTVKDCMDLKGSLSKLGFDVRVYVDPNVQTISSTLRLTAAEDHADADCLVVAAMSHGESGLLHSYDNLYPVDMLWTHFTGDRCPGLAGKPKLFFIQACRGTRLDERVKIIHETDSKATTYSIPTYADIMVAYSTYDGFYSWRNPDAGSWFIQAICEEFNLHGRSRDLLTLMTFVNRRVAIEYQSYVPHDQTFHARKQIPSIVSMLTRLVYFTEKTTLIPDDTDQPANKNQTGTIVSTSNQHLPQIRHS